MQRNPALDGMRALAVLAVVAFHCRVPLLPGGFLGVDLFFVLSGFLITGLLAAEVESSGRVYLLRFYTRRALRLTPPLMVLLIGYLALAPLFWPETSAAAHGRDALLAGLYLSDYSRALFGVPEVLTHSWSLSVEEHYYLVWPLLLVPLCRSRSRDEQLKILIIAFCVATLWRAINVLVLPGWTPIYYRFDTHLSGLILGGIAALGATEWKRLDRRVADILAIGSLAILLGSALLWRWGDPRFLLWGLTLVELAAAGLVISLVGAPGLVHRMLAWRPAAFLGLISYAVYLWHYPISRYMREDNDPLVTFAVVTVVSVSLAAASWFAVEKPLARYRHRIWADAKQAAPAT